MRLTFRQLETFTEVVRQGSIQRAAEAMRLTQPAVSMQIKQLEGHVGQRLFDRGGRRLSLTAAGEQFLFQARKILATLKETEDAMGRFSRLESGRLTIGMVSAAKYFLPHLLAQFNTEHRAVEIRLRLGVRDVLGAMLEAREVDLCIMGRAPREVPCRAEPFAQHPHVIVTAPGHRFARAEEVPAAALADEPFIVREADSGTRAVLQEYLDEYRIQPKFLMEMPSNEAIKQAVMAGMGVSLLSLHTLALELKMGLIVAPQVEGFPRVRRWNLIHAGTSLSPAAEAFRYFILEHAEGYLASLFPDTSFAEPARRGQSRRRSEQNARKGSSG
jgi:LysR family transcriptional regulator, low CO2-responsive transcriptional regulator